MGILDVKIVQDYIRMCTDALSASLIALVSKRSL